MLELVHLLHDIHDLWTLHVDETKRSYINAIVLEILEIECLDVLEIKEKVFLLGCKDVRVSMTKQGETYKCGKHIMVAEVIHLKL